MDACFQHATTGLFRERQRPHVRQQDGFVLGSRRGGTALQAQVGEQDAGIGDLTGALDRQQEVDSPRVPEQAAAESTTRNVDRTIRKMFIAGSTLK
jgi:hypothetical protein